MSEEHVYSIVPRINGVTLTFGSLPDSVTRQGAITFNVAETASFERLLEMMNLQVLLSFQGKEGNQAVPETRQASGTQALQREDAEKKSRVRIFPFLGNRQENLKLTAAIIKQCTRYNKEIDFELPGFFTCLRKWRYCRYYFSSVPTVLMEITNIPLSEEELFRFHIYQALIECYGMDLSAERVELFKREIYNVKADEQNFELTIDEDSEQMKVFSRQNGAESPDKVQDLDQDERWEEVYCGQAETDAAEGLVSKQDSKQDSEQDSEQVSEQDSEQVSEQVSEQSAQAQIYNAQKEQAEDHGSLGQDRCAEAESGAPAQTNAQNRENKRVKKQVVNSRVKHAKTKGKGKINLQSLFLPPDGPLFQFASTTPAENLKYPLPPHLDSDSVMPFNVSCRGKECGCGAVAEKSAQSKPDEESIPGVKFIPVERENVKLPTISS